MKSLARPVSAFAWGLAAIVQLVLVAQRPEKVVVFGTDVSHDNTMVLVHGLVFIACGLLLAIASYIWKRWSSLLVGASSVLYLVSWFPFRSAYQHGLIATFNARFVVGMNPGYRLPFITRDIVLPIAFVLAFVLVMLEMRRRSPSPVRT